MTTLPVSTRLAWWGTAWLRGLVSPDELLDQVHLGGVPHLVTSPDSDPASVITVLAGWRSRGATAVGAAYPAEGDPVGLGGPAPLTTDAIEAGEAVLAVGAPAALVPWRVGPTYQWTAHDAERRQLPDVGEADRALRSALLAAADRLVDLDVARWRPEVADELLNLRHSSPITGVPGVPQRCLDLTARALRAVRIADLALDDEGGAISASQMAERRDAIEPLARAGRRALTAASSPDAWPDRDTLPSR